MYELKNGKVFTSKFVGTGPSSCEKNYLQGRGLRKFDKHCPRGTALYSLPRRLRNYFEYSVTVYQNLRCHVS